MRSSATESSGPPRTDRGQPLAAAPMDPAGCDPHLIWAAPRVPPGDRRAAPRQPAGGAGCSNRGNPKSERRSALRDSARTATSAEASRTRLAAQRAHSASSGAPCESARRRPAGQGGGNFRNCCTPQRGRIATIRDWTRRGQARRTRHFQAAARSPRRAAASEGRGGRGRAVRSGSGRKLGRRACSTHRQSST